MPPGASASAHPRHSEFYQFLECVIQLGVGVGPDLNMRTIAKDPQPFGVVSVLVPLGVQNPGSDCTWWSVARGVWAPLESWCALGAAIPEQDHFTMLPVCCTLVV